MSNEIKQTYRDVEITYIESSDRWNFTANGRERNADSLAKAKESINRALDQERKEKPWEPFEAYFSRGYSGSAFEKVTVTSLAAHSGYSTTKEFWINGNGKRSKQRVTDLYAASPENETRIGQYVELRKRIKLLEKEATDVINSMDHVKEPDA